MLGTTNASYDVSNAFNETLYSKDLTYKAGGAIAKGDLVEIISEDLPDEVEVNTVDTAAAYFISLSQPRELDNNTAIYQAFHLNQSAPGNLCSTGTTVGAAGPQHIYSSSWSSTLSNITKANALSNSIVLSKYASYCWGEPNYIGNGFWLIPGDNSNIKGSANDALNISQGEEATLTYPSQIILVYVDQSSGLATPVYVAYDNVAESATAAQTNAFQYGHPIICQISDTDFIFIHKNFENGMYQIVARAFTVKIDPDSPTNSTIKWTSNHKSLSASTTAITNYCQCCHFVDKEVRELYVLTNTYNKFARIGLEYNGTMRMYDDTLFEVDMTECLEVNPSLKSYNPMYGVPIVVPYHNNLASYNCILTDDNKHFLNVYNNYYWDFEIHYENIGGTSSNNRAVTMTARIIPLSKNLPMQVRVSQLGSANATTFLNTNNGYREWDMAAGALKGLRCNSNLNPTTGQIPCLYKVSRDKYLMAFLSSVTVPTGNNALVGVNSVSQSAITAASALAISTNGAAIYVMLNYNDKMHSLQRVDRMGHCSCLGTAIAVPDPGYSKNIIFVDPNGYIHHIVPYYSATTYLYPTSKSTSKLTTSQMYNMAYKYGTKPVSKKVNLHRIEIGIAKTAAAYGEDVIVTTMPYETSMLFKSIEEGGSDV